MLLVGLSLGEEQLAAVVVSGLSGGAESRVLVALGLRLDFGAVREK